MYNKAHQQYRTVQISTVDRGRLLLMMYDGGIKFLRQAKAGLEAKDIVKFARFISKSQAVIAELQNTLDFEVGGTIAKDLDRLYDFMLFYLTEANLQKDPNKIQRVINLLDTIAGAYRHIIENDPVATQRAVEEVQERMERDKAAKRAASTAEVGDKGNKEASVPPPPTGLRLSL